MTWLLVEQVLSWAWPFILTAIVAVGAYLKGGNDKAAKVEKKYLQAEIQSQKERAELIKQSHKIENDVEALSDEEARKEAMQWSNKKP